jgi:hypothetical protein
MRAFLLAGLFVSGLMVVGCAAGEGPGVAIDDARADCSLVRCLLPLCADGQHLVNRGGCCPQCVGQPSRCATVLCAAVACAEGEQLVTTPGDCCGHCQPTPPVAECTTDQDCPVFNCFACPCPVSFCQGNQCMTSTPDASTCYSGI